MVYSNDGRILMTKNSKPGWELPGGHVETQDSSPAACAVREVLEEKGYVLAENDLTYVGALLLHNSPQVVLEKGYAPSGALVFFRASGSPTEPLRAYFECVEASWFPVEETLRIEEESRDCRRFEWQILTPQRRDGYPPGFS